MSWAATAIVGGSVIGAYASSSAASDAADAQIGAAKLSSDTQMNMYNQTREDQQPFRDGGYQALSALLYGAGQGDGINRTASNFDSAAYLKANPDVGKDPYYSANPYQHYLDYGQAEGRSAPWLRTAAQSGISQGEFNKDFTLSDFQKDPGYQFRMSEGMRGVQNSAAARGGLLNGGTLKALSQYGQDFASNEYQNAYNRFNTDRTNRFNRLASLAGVGQTANNAIAAAGTNAANQVSSNQLAAGNAQASSYIGQANALNSGINSMQSLYTINKMFPSSTPNATSKGGYTGADYTGYGAGASYSDASSLWA